MKHEFCHNLCISLKDDLWRLQEPFLYSLIFPSFPCPSLKNIQHMYICMYMCKCLCVSLGPVFLPHIESLQTYVWETTTSHQLLLKQKWRPWGPRAAGQKWPWMGWGCCPVGPICSSVHPVPMLVNQPETEPLTPFQSICMGFLPQESDWDIASPTARSRGRKCSFMALP